MSNPLKAIASLLLLVMCLFPSAPAIAANFNPDNPRVVRAFYLVPQDREVKQDYVVAIATAMKAVQSWYQRELGLTFSLATPLVEVRRLSHDEAYYSAGRPTADQRDSTWTWWYRTYTDIDQVIGVKSTPANEVDPTSVYAYFADLDWSCDYVRADPWLNPQRSINTGQEGVGRALMARPVLAGLTGEPQVPSCPGGLTVTSFRNDWGICSSATHTNSEVEEMQGTIAHELGHTFGLPHPWERELSNNNHPDHQEFAKARGFSPSRRQVFYNCLPADTAVFRTIMGLGGTKFPNTGFFGSGDRVELLAGGIATAVKLDALNRFLALDEGQQILANASPRGDIYRRAGREQFFTRHPYAVPTCIDPDGWGLALGVDHQTYTGSNGRFEDHAEILAAVQVSEEFSNNGNLIRGYLCPPVTGDYTFWLSSNNRADFYLGTVPHDPDSKRKMIDMTVSTNPDEWRDENQSNAIRLEQGKPYYIELHHSGEVQHHLSLAWAATGSNGSAFQRQLVAGTHLRRFEALSSIPVPGLRVNLAATQMTRYSDTSGAVTDLQGTGSAKAVDSNLSTTESDLFRTPSPHADPWWEVWFAGRSHPIHQINIHSCVGCNDELTNFYVFISPTPMPDDQSLSAALQGAANGAYWVSDKVTQLDRTGWTTIPVSNVDGSVVRVWLERPNGTLTLAEVEVW